MRAVAIALAILMLALPASSVAVPDGSIALLDRPSGFGALPFDGAFQAGFSRHTTVSANGCFVVFSSGNDVLMTTDVDSAFNVYRLDRCTPGQPLEQVNTSASGV